MRQLSPLTNILLAVAAALGLVASLAFPWFGPEAAPNEEIDGAMERIAHGIARMFTESGATGDELLGSKSTIVLVLAGVVAALSVSMLLPFLRPALRDLLRAVALATPAVVAYLAIDQSSGVDVRWGLLVSLAAALFMASAAWHGSTIRDRKPAPGAWQRTA